LISIAAAGDNVVDVYPAIGLMYPGGNTVNVAVAARRSGARAAYLGAVGSDRPGQLIRQALGREGVETPRLRVAGEGNTAYCTVELLDGERRFGPSDAGVSHLQLSEADLQYLAGFDCVHTGDCSMLESQVAALAARVAVSYDFSNRPPSYYRPLLPYVTYASFSAGHLPPAQAEEMAHDVARQGPAVVLITEGRRGALLLRDGRLVRLPSQVTKVTDTLGAGDAVIGGVLARLLAGSSPGEALAHGLSLAAAACQQYGAFGYPAPMTDLPAALAVRREDTTAPG
jgi:fructoselysine 6-kinase